MAELTKWKSIKVQQEHEISCIAAGYEWLLKYLGIENIDYSTFQTEFNLQGRGIADNNFETIANAIENKYPNISFNFRDFTHGNDKIIFIESLISMDNPCLISIANSPDGGWHIMPVVYIDTNIIVCFDYGLQQINRYTINEIIYRHENWKGGKNIAWIMNICR